MFVLGAVAHTLGKLQPPEDPAVLDALRHMADTKQSMAGLSFSLQDAFDCLGWYMSALSALVGLTGLLMLRSFANAPGRLRVMSLVHAVGSAALAGTALRFGVAPPTAVYGIAAVLFTFALFRAGAHVRK